MHTRALYSDVLDTVSDGELPESWEESIDGERVAFNVRRRARDTLKDLLLLGLSEAAAVAPAKGRVLG